MAVGAATILGSFAARLGIDTNDYGRGVLQAQAMNSAFGQSFTNFITNPLLGSIDLFARAGAGVLKLADHFAKVGGSVLATGEELQRMSQITGASTAMIQALRGKMDEASGSGEKLGQALNVMNRQLDTARRNGGSLADTFGELGVDLENLGTTDDVIAQLVDGIDRLDSASARTRAAMMVFGEEAGPRLINAVGGGRKALDEMREAASDLSRVWQDDWIDPLAQGNTDLGNFKQTLVDIERIFVAGFLAAFIKEFGTGDEALRKFSRAVQNEFLPMVQEFGEDVGSLATSMKTLAENADLALQVFKAMVDPLGNIARTVGAIEGAANAANDIEAGSPVREFLYERPKELLEANYERTVRAFDGVGTLIENGSGR